MRTIKLYGHLRKKFGKLHKFDVKSPAEAIRALAANFKEFRTEFAKGCYAIVVNGKEDLPLDRLTFQGAGEIKIVPIVAGAGGSNGWTNILIGVAVIAIGAMTFGAGGWLGSYAWSAYALSATVGMGSSLVLGGISQLLATPPKLGLPADKAGNQPSLAFDGPVNTYAQGQPVPIGYGELLLGSNVASASVRAGEVSLGNNPIVTCGGGLPVDYEVETPDGPVEIGTLIKGDAITFYDADNYDFTPVEGTVEFAATKKGSVITVEFDDGPTVTLARDTDVYLYEKYVSCQVCDLEVGDKVAKAGGGSLEVTNITVGGLSSVRQITPDWFSETSTGLLFRTYRTGNTDDDERLT